MNTVYALSAIDGGITVTVTVGENPEPYRWAAVTVRDHRGVELDRQCFVTVAPAVRFAQDAVL